MSGSLPPQAAPGGIFAGLGRLLKRPAAIRPRVPHEFSDTEFSENEFALEASEPLPQWDGVAVPLEELLDQSEARMAARQKAQDANAAATASGTTSSSDSGASGTPSLAPVASQPAGENTAPADGSPEAEAPFQPLHMPAPAVRRSLFGRRRSAC